MSAPLLLIEKLQKLPVSEEAKKDLSTKMVQAYSKCMCRECPSYYVCKAAVETKEPVLYCNPMRGKSAAINRELGCLCSACPVYAMNNFTEDGWYCTRGPAKEMVAMMSKLVGQENQVPASRKEPEGTICMDENCENVIVTMKLPGVTEDNIDLKILESGFRLTARRRDVEFVDSHSFDFPVNADKATVTFKDDVLKIVVPVKSKRS